MSYVERCAQMLYWTVIVIGAFAVVDLFFHVTPYDATDRPPGRSGLRLHTDAQSGCEYLSTSRGGITPRLNSDGRQAGCRP